MCVFLLCVANTAVNTIFIAAAIEKAIMILFTKPNRTAVFSLYELGKYTLNDFFVEHLELVRGEIDRAHLISVQYM